MTHTFVTREKKDSVQYRPKCSKNPAQSSSERLKMSASVFLLYAIGVKRRERERLIEKSHNFTGALFEKIRHFSSAEFVVSFIPLHRVFETAFHFVHSVACSGSRLYLSHPARPGQVRRYESIKKCFQWYFLRGTDTKNQPADIEVRTNERASERILCLWVPKKN